VYSASLVAWAAAAVDTPFRGVRAQEHESKVASGDRPWTFYGEPPALRALLVRAWAPKPESRCTAAELADGLTEVLIPIRFGNLPALPPPAEVV